MAERHVSVPKSFANGDVNEWFKRYEICCKANGWNEVTDSTQVADAPRGRGPRSLVGVK